MAVVSSVKNLTKIPDVIKYVDSKKGQTKEFLKAEKLFKPSRLNALERDIKKNLDELFSTPVKIRVPDEGLKGILNDGRVKSQFETGYSQGGFNPGARAEVETYNFGYAPDIQPKKRPIYGYVGKGDANQYGNNVLVMKKENKPRTTITNGDSLDEDVEWNNGLATPISWGNNSLDFVGTPEAIDKYITFWGKEDAADEIESILEGLKIKKSKDKIGYIESQIHGGVTPNDFAGIVLGNPEKDLNLRKSAADKFGFELRAVDPRDGKSRCFYNCREPAQEKQELLELIERGDFYRR